MQSVPFDQKNQPVHSCQMKNLMTLIIAASCIYLVVTSFTLITILTLLMLSIAILKLCHIKYKRLRKQGFSSKLSEGLKKVLFDMSIFDIFNDSIYFDTVTPIIAAFITPAITRPSPENLHQQFESLPNDVKEVISTKGLLSLAPSNVQQFFLNKKKPIQLPQVYGKTSWQWYNLKKYESHDQKIHQQTISKQFREGVDKRISWTALSVLGSLVTYGVISMKSGRLKKMFIQNGSLMGMILIIAIACAKIKAIQIKLKAKKKIFQEQEDLKQLVLEKDQKKTEKILSIQQQDN